MGSKLDRARQATVRGYVGRTTSRAPKKFLFVDPAAVAETAKWAAGGFALLAGLLGFFGIREGVLYRLLRTEPDRALLVFLLIGLGVVASLLATTFQKDLMVRVYAPCAVIFLLGVSASILGFHGITFFRVIVAMVGFGALALTVVVLWDKDTSLVAATLVLGVVSTAMGLYAAATMAVESKGQPADAPRVTAAFAKTEQGNVFTIEAAASQREDAPLVILLHGHAEGAESRLGRAVLTADAAGEIDVTQTFPVTSPEWTELSVGYCRNHDAAQSVDAKCEMEETARFDLDPGEVRPPGIGATLSPVTGGIQATITAVNVLPGSVVRARVARLRSGVRQEHLGWLVGDANGTATWTVTVAGTRKADDVLVSYVVCPPACDEDPSWTTVARYPVR